MANGLLDALGKQYLEAERTKERQKNETAMMKMRIQSLQREAEAYESEQKGADDTMRQVAPVVALLQDQAAAAANETAEANRRAAMSEITRVQDQLVARDIEPQSISSMGDVVKLQENMLRAAFLENPELLEHATPMQVAMLFGSETAKLLPSERLTQEVLSSQKDIEKHQRQVQKEVEAKWQSTVMSVVSKGLAEMKPPEEIAKDVEIIAQYFQLTLPEFMQPSEEPIPAERIGGHPYLPGKKPIPARETRELVPPLEGRPRIKEGEPMGMGPNIRAGRQPVELTKEEERTALREGYTNIIKENFPMYSDVEIEELVNDLEEQGGLFPVTMGGEEAEALTRGGAEMYERHAPRLMAKEEAERKKAERKERKKKAARPPMMPTAREAVGLTPEVQEKIGEKVRGVLQMEPTATERFARRLLFGEAAGGFPTYEERTSRYAGVKGLQKLLRDVQKGWPWQKEEERAKALRK